MKTVIALCAVPAAILVSACTQTTADIEAERAALRAAADAYHEAGQNLDADGFAGSYTSDGLLLPPNAAAVNGRDGAREFIAAFAEAPGAGVSFSGMQIEIAASGDMGYTLADAVVTVDGPDGLPVEEKIRDFHLWTKEDGEWRIAVDVWNSGTPAAESQAVTSAPSGPLADALSAAWPGMTADAMVVDWEGNVLKEGSNGYTCLPTPPMLTGTSPMCMDTEWMEWANAWQNKTDYVADSLGIAYMLAGDEGASNIDPYAEGPTEDNDWVREGAHLMVIAPAELLSEYPTDPDNGGPYVMWNDTPYAHLMVPVGSRD